MPNWYYFEPDGEEREPKKGDVFQSIKTEYPPLFSTYRMSTKRQVLKMRRFSEDPLKEIREIYERYHKEMYYKNGKPTITDEEMTNECFMAIRAVMQRFEKEGK